MSPREGIAGSFARKIAIATRLFGKELQRGKLKWFDLQRADYRLGEKMLAAGVSVEHFQFAQRVNQIDDRLTSLRQLEQKSSGTFREKVKAWWSGMVRTARIAALKRKRRSTLKQLGAAVRKSSDPNVLPSDEAHAASQIAEKIGSIDASIRELRSSTYVWARRPLLASSLILLLAVVGLALFKAQRQQSLFVRQNNRPSSLSDEQFKKIESQTQAFREQMLRQQAELLHQETEAKQARIAAKSDEQRRDVLRRAQEEVQRQVAAAEDAYKKQQERQRAEAKKRQREEVQERERVAAARAKAEGEDAARQKAAKDKEKEAGRIAASKEQEEGAKGKQAGGGNESDKTVGLAAMIAALAVQESNNAAAQPSASPRKSESSRSTETPAATKLREAAEKFTVGRYAEAFKTYEEAISLDPDSPKGYLARGWAFFSTSQKDAALKDFDEAIKRAPKDPEAYFRRGLVHASASEYEKAVADFTKAIECRPDYERAYYERGVSRAATRQFDQAREDFDNVIRRDAKNALAYLNRGRVFIESRETEKALSDFNRAIELSDHEPAVYLGRGAAYLQLGKYEDAQKDLEQAILLNREFVPAYKKLAEVFSARRNEALAALNRGRAYFYSHEYPRATAEFERAAELQPKLAAAHLELGRSKSAQGIIEIAAATEKRETERNDIRDDEKIDRAVVQIRDHFSKPAVESLREAARLDPENAQIQLELGRAYFYWASASAIAAFEKAQQLDSKSAEPRFWLGMTKYTWGDEREVWKDGTRDEFRARLALKDLNAALELDPQHAGAYYFRASANHTLKQYDDAIADLGAAAERSAPATHYLEYAAVLYSPNKRMMQSVERVPDELVAISLKTAALAQRAQCYSEKGLHDSALADSDQVVRALPTDPRVFRLRAFVHNQAGSRAAEQADLRRAIHLALPASRDRRTATDYEACIDESKHQLQRNSRDADAHIKLGDCYRGIGKFDLAQREYDYAIEVSPKAKALLDHSIEREKARYCYAAIDDLDELTKLEPNNAALYYRKAKLYLMDHNTEGANPNFQRAAELDPTNREYAMRASHPVAPFHQLTGEQMLDNLLTGLATAAVVVVCVGVAAETMTIDHSKQIVAESGGKKKLCPKCKGRTVITLYEHAPPAMNPYRWGTDEYQLFEVEQRNKTTMRTTECDECHGTGVVDAR
jgi:tetratricopeptide (TPR) repeat protein